MVRRIVPSTEESLSAIESKSNESKPNKAASGEARPEKGAAYRAALAAVIILSLLIVLALGVLVVRVAHLLTRSPHGAAPAAAQTFTLPPGAKILETESQPGRLILHLKGPAGEEIAIVNTANGKLVSLIKTGP
jgi:hypothetical protein